MPEPRAVYATVFTVNRWKIVDDASVSFPLGNGLVTVNFRSHEEMVDFAQQIWDHAMNALADDVANVDLESSRDTTKSNDDNEDGDDTSTFVEDPVVVADREAELWGYPESESEREEVSEEVAADGVDLGAHDAEELGNPVGDDGASNDPNECDNSVSKGL